MIKVSPSMLSGDFSKFGEEVKRISDCGADMLHFDIMDGLFVPNITFGAPVLKSVRKYSQIFFDVHLMIDEPLKYIEDFVSAGADMITFHIECKSDTKETIKKIKSFGVKAGLSVKPGTPVEAILPYLDDLDNVLIMTVEPGFGGQKFMSDMIEKIEYISKVIKEKNRDIFLQVDGGINRETVLSVVKAGANLIVAGSAVFNAHDPAEEIKYLKSISENV